MLRDSWYDKYHAAKESPEFVAWWIDEYGSPEDFDESYNEQHEYWTRRAFALMGFNAGRSLADGEDVKRMNPCEE